MAWHLGYPLSQTLFTSVYIDALTSPPPASLEEATFTRGTGSQGKQPKLLFVLRAFCIGLLKACHYVNEIVKDELYYEVPCLPRTAKSL
jgi:N-alpha-acetyltransferase 35, NatC auxiliary subunit